MAWDERTHKPDDPVTWFWSSGAAPDAARFWRSLHQHEFRRAQTYRRALIVAGVAQAVTLIVAALGWWS